MTYDEKRLMKHPRLNSVSFQAGYQVMKKIDSSHVINKGKYDNLPRLCRDDLVLQRFLGNGSFSNVFEVTHTFNRSDNSCSGIQSTKASNHTASTVSDDNLFDSFDLKPDRIEKEKVNKKYDSTKINSQRYALKELKCNNPNKMKVGAVDILFEAYLLSSLENPNIIKIRGVSSAGLRGFDFGNKDGFFFLMDKLDGTLEERLTTWREQSVRVKKTIKFRSNSSKSTAMLLPRLKAAIDVASAMKYLHEMNIIYRDTKPANIGFNNNGNAVLFDFGLAKELHDDKKMSDGSYMLTGLVGTIRYMAPEVVKQESYNQKSDVYSFGVLLWELMSLQTPFDGYDHRQFLMNAHNQTKKLGISKSWPSPIQDLVSRCLYDNFDDRPNFDVISTVLEKEIDSILLTMAKTKSKPLGYALQQIQRISKHAFAA